MPTQEIRKVRNALIQHGYDVLDITFTKTDDFSALYKSSRPIVLTEDITCEYWEIDYFGMTGAFSYAVPYPSKKWPEPVTVTITFPPDEYKHITEKMGSTSILKK